MSGETDALLTRTNQEAKIFSECLHSLQENVAFEAFCTKTVT